MHDNPRATEREQEVAQEGERQQDEDAMRGPEHHDPELARERALEDE
jgi:hypothetical protein